MQIIVPLTSLLFAAALLLGSNGMQSTLLSVRGTLEDFSGFSIALLMTAYFAGFILGCRQAPGLIGRVGHIRAFVALASVASAVALSHALFVESWFWIATRVMTGFCFAGLQMIMESWLNDRATNENRGRVLSVYRITDFTSATLFQAILPVFNPESFVPFAFLSILISLALVPIALTRVEAPSVPATMKLDIPRIWHVSPLAAAGATLVGMAASSYWAMGAVFVAGLGYQPEATGYFIGALIFGGALAQWPLGWMSDRMDRRYVIIGVSIVATAAAVALVSIAEISQTALVLSGLVFGAVSVPSFGLTLAHANDHAEPGHSVAVNGGLLLLYGVAATVAPLIASVLMARFGTGVLFYWVAGIYAVLAAFGIVRVAARRAPATRDHYVPVMRTQPGIFELDPRVDPAEAEPGPGPELPLGAAEKA